MKGSPITAAVAVLALAVGGASAVGGVLVEKAADRQVCAATVKENAAVRGLLGDFINSNPKVTPAERHAADAIALKRFPPNC